jgi:hypothetical protein
LDADTLAAELQPNQRAGAPQDSQEVHEKLLLNQRQHSKQKI